MARARSTQRRPAMPQLWNIQRAVTFARWWGFLLGVVLSQLVTRYTESTIDWEYIPLTWIALFVVTVSNAVHYLVIAETYTRYKMTRNSMMQRMADQSKDKKAWWRKG